LGRPFLVHGRRIEVQLLAQMIPTPPLPLRDRYTLHLTDSLNLDRLTLFNGVPSVVLSSEPFLAPSLNSRGDSSGFVPSRILPSAL